jgi:hypothetical protein
VVRENSYLRPFPYGRPVGKLKSDLLVIVEDGNLGLIHALMFFRRVVRWGELFIKFFDVIAYGTDECRGLTFPIPLHPAVVGAAKVSEKLAAKHHPKVYGRSVLARFFGGRHGAAIMTALEIEGQGESGLAIHTGCLGKLTQLFGQGDAPFLAVYLWPLFIGGRQYCQM